MKRVGSGITERVKPGMVKATPANIRSFFEGIRKSAHEPWGGQGRIIESARARLSEIKESAPSFHEDLDGYNSFFIERVTEGWYLDEIDVEAKVTELAVDEGRPWEAVACAMRIGELLTELRMKLLWEPDAIAGRKQRRNREEAIAAWRRGSQESRVREVDARPAGTPKSQMFRRIAKREGVTPSAIKTDYYSAKKILSKPND